MPANHKVTLAELRELADSAGLDLAIEMREATHGMRWVCCAYREGLKIETRDGSRMAARRQLRDLLQLVVMGRAAAKVVADRLERKSRVTKERRR